VEASCLSTVESPDVKYKLKLYKDDHPAAKALSNLQLEAVTYACQRYATKLPNKERSGFFIGDGAGMGKGREIAGLVIENMLHGRTKSLWVSVSTDLKIDAERDLADCGAGLGELEVVALNKCPYGKLDLDDSTVLFTTYASLISAQSGNRKKKRRLDQVIEWLGEKFDGA
jgi:hypothetical protein